MPEKITSFMDKTTLIRIATTCMVIAVILFIFFNSGRTGSQSGVISREITAAVSGQPVTEKSLLETIIRKIGHLAEYALLGLALYFCMQTYTTKLGLATGWMLFIGLTVALADECYQLTVEGRSGQLSDVWIDLGGILAGLLLARLSTHIWRKLAKNKNVNTV